MVQSFKVGSEVGMTFDFEGRFGSVVSAMKGQKVRVGSFRQCQRSVHPYPFDMLRIQAFFSRNVLRLIQVQKEIHR